MLQGMGVIITLWVVGNLPPEELREVVGRPPWSTSLKWYVCDQNVLKLVESYNPTPSLFEGACLGSIGKRLLVWLAWSLWWRTFEQEK